MADLQLEKEARLALLADFVIHEKEKNVSEKEIEEKLIFTYGLTRVEAAQLIAKK